MLLCKTIIRNGLKITESKRTGTDFFFFFIAFDHFIKPINLVFIYCNFDNNDNIMFANYWLNNNANGFQVINTDMND